MLRRNQKRLRRWRLRQEWKAFKVTTQRSLHFNTAVRKAAAEMLGWRLCLAWRVWHVYTHKMKRNAHERAIVRAEAVASLESKFERRWADDRRELSRALERAEDYRIKYHAEMEAFAAARVEHAGATARLTTYITSYAASVENDSTLIRSGCLSASATTGGRSDPVRTEAVLATLRSLRFASGPPSEVWDLLHDWQGEDFGAAEVLGEAETLVNARSLQPARAAVVTRGLEMARESSESARLRVALKKALDNWSGHVFSGLTALGTLRSFGSSLL